jgi:hypothetical protein
MLGFLNLLREVLGWFQMVRSERKDVSDSRPVAQTSASAQAQPSLRPPTIALDMLFLLAFIAFLEMNPVSENENVISHSANLPTADKTAEAKPISPLVLRPVRTAKSWLYETADGARLSAGAVAVRVRRQNMTPILVIPESSSVQTYLDAQQPLMRKGLANVGLAVNSEGENRQ